jgi:hypothetical protein
MNVLRLTHAGLVGVLFICTGCNHSKSSTTDTIDFDEAGIEWNLMAECHGRIYDAAFNAPSPIPMREPFEGVEIFFIVNEELDINLSVSKETPSIMDGRVLGYIVPVSISWNGNYPNVQFSAPDCRGTIFTAS